MSSQVRSRIHSRGDFSSGFSSSGAVTVLALLTPTQVKPEHKGTILWLGPTSGSPNLELSQELDQVSLRLRTAVDGRATENITGLCQWPDDKTHFLAVTYAESVLAVYLDGKQVMRTESVKGDLSRWRATEVVFGDNFQATADWPGKHEGIAIYDRALSEAEIEQQATAFTRTLAARKEPPQLRIIGKLKARSMTPEPARILPYYQSLGVYEYAVEEVKEGKCDGSTILVTHWVIMQKKKLSIAARKIGSRVELLLEPYDANPQLKNDFWLFDDAEKLDLPLMFDISRPQP
ncbi:MAG: hypothetical protein O3B01_23565 [Planctomycetota bacterium]|nr:hypothetical protein [Planctomycetota bacterium]MDA1141550.1 hypothetical protein [Planctomycetota bacterium]